MTRRVHQPKPVRRAQDVPALPAGPVRADGAVPAAETRADKDPF